MSSQSSESEIELILTFWNGLIESGTKKFF